MRIVALASFFAVLAAAASFAFGADDPKGIEFFEKKIRPVLVASCYKCHSKEAKSVKAGLLVDSMEGIRKGGESGPAVVPGDVESSLLINAIKHEDFEMPPKGKLPEAVINDFVTWVKIGAPDPREDKGESATPSDVRKIARDHWSFQVPRQVQPPEVHDQSWPRGEIDRFVLARLEQNGLHPVADADPRVLIRRIYFDLVGLPPILKEVDGKLKDELLGIEIDLSSFTRQPSTLIDALLDTPQFGERWGRHWLDVARYAESNGNADNTAFPHAWRYRNYVIDSFNNDKPYDQFIREQLAGDLLPFDNPRQRNEQLIATGFLALGPKPRAQNNPNFQMDVVAEQIEVTTSAMLGLTVLCARCHDHKFDPIPTSEYYGLAGIFTSTKTLYGSAGRNKRTPAGGLVSLLAEDDKAADKAAEHARQVADLNGRQRKLTSALAKLGVRRNQNAKQANQIAKLKRQLKKLRAKGAKERQIDVVKQRLARLGFSNGENTAEDPNKQKRIKQLQTELKAVESDLDRLRASVPKTAGFAMGVSEGTPGDTQVCIRGESQNRGDRVPRGFITVSTTGEPPAIEAGNSGRLALSKWITDPSNPLTARVIVNRVWYHLFGRGLVTTLDNFGALGEGPSHPELLDYLAVRFMKEGWSVKKLVREVMLTRTYQLSSDHDPRNYARDPDNVWLWRMSPRRLDAEVLRDSILAVSGTLDLERPKPESVEVDKRGRAVRRANQSNSVHRSVYLPVIRNGVPESLGLFDFADPSIVVGQRDVTTVPAQSLFFMNSPFIVRQSELMAKRLATGDGGAMKDDERVGLAFRLALARRPTGQQRQRALAFIKQATETLGRQKAWAGFCQSLLASTEFRYVE